MFFSPGLIDQILTFECTLDFSKWIRGGRYPGLFHHNDKVIIRPFVCCACAIAHQRELFEHMPPPPLKLTFLRARYPTSVIHANIH